jgi:urea transport system permease protein
MQSPGNQVFSCPGVIGAWLMVRIALVLGALLCSVPCRAEGPDDAPPAASTLAEAQGTEAALALLRLGGFLEKGQAIDRLAADGGPAAVTYMQTLLEGRLYQVKAGGRLVIAEPAEGGFRLTDPEGGAALGQAAEADLAKITINNALRSRLKAAIARLSLGHPQPAVRLAAVTGMLERLQPDSVPLLKARLAQEQDPRVREALEAGLSLADLGIGDRGQQLAAITALSGNLTPAVRNQLGTLVESQDKVLAQAARRSLAAIEGKVQFYRGIETLFFGLSLGSVLVLAAIGLAITFGVMGVINMAHGELMMLGAYTTYLIQALMPGYLEWSLLVAIPAAFVVAGLAGILIEQMVIRFLYGRPLETLLATFGISLILQQLVRTLISPQNVPVANPAWMAGSLEVNSVLSLTYSRLYIILFCLLVFAGLYLILRRTSLGLQVRAVAQNRPMARALGVPAARVDALTFGLGSGVAGIAGVALSQLTNVGPNLGQTYIIDSFMVVVFGGVGNLMGTLVAGLSLGVANKLLEPWSGAVLAKILVLVFIILFIQKRPRGLFPQKGRAADA